MVEFLGYLAGTFLDPVKAIAAALILLMTWGPRSSAQKRAVVPWLLLVAVGLIEIAIINDISPVRHGFLGLAYFTSILAMVLWGLIFLPFFEKRRKRMWAEICNDPAFTEDELARINRAVPKWEEPTRD